MNKRILLLVSCLTLVIYVYGQKETEHFKYEKLSSGYIQITPKNLTNNLLSKEPAVLFFIKSDYPKDYLKTMMNNVHVKPLQELIDSGAFTKERMKELEKEDRTQVVAFLDETGQIGYVCFRFTEREKSLLTDKELWLIYQKLKTAKYDLTYMSGFSDRKGHVKVFCCEDGFYIPFKELKY